MSAVSNTNKKDIEFIFRYTEEAEAIINSNTAAMKRKAVLIFF